MPRGAAPTGTGFVAALGRYIGVPYEWGGASPSGFDCSGLVEYTLTRLGVPNVPRTSQEQYTSWAQKVPAGSVQPGDLVFFNFPQDTQAGANHVAVYAGAGKVIQAPGQGQFVQRVPFTVVPAGSQEWGGTVLGYGRIPGLSYPRNRVGVRGRPPRPGNPNNPGGKADPSTGGDDAAAAAWTRYADELTTPTEASSRFASLHIFGVPIPGTGWFPSWLDPGSSFGVPGLSSWNPLSSFGEASDAVSGVDSFFHWIAWIFHPRNVLRIVEAVFGVGLILVGLSFARGSSGSDGGGSSIGRKASGLFAATPIGREARVAKAAVGGRRAARAERGLAKTRARGAKESSAFARAKNESRRPSETRDQHKRRRAKERRDNEVPF
jgi:hypothetical protein